jgi:DNA-binding IclR family transcriptional regulator
LQELERVREQGYSVDDEENSLGARCVGAPIFNGEGNVEAAIASTGTINDVPRDAVPHIADMVKEAARRISHQLGYRGPYPKPMSAE